MNKKEFMGSLEKQLKYLPKEDKKDALDYYAEYIDDCGFPEDADLAQKIGNPKEIARNIIADCTMKYIDQNEEKSSPKKTAKIVWITILSIFSLPITLPLALALVIILISFLITILSIFISFFAVGLCVVAVGAVVIFTGFFAPGIGQKLVCFGMGLLLIGLGLLICFATAWIFSLIIKLIINIIKKQAVKKQMGKN